MAKIKNSPPLRMAWLPLVLGGVVCVSLATATYAQVEMDPSKQYEVTPADGDWMICIASYSGEAAKELAHRLVMEIRQSYHRAAFVYNRADAERRAQQAEFDREAEAQRQRFQAMGVDPSTPVHHRIVQIEDECAVLVGGYKDMATARSDLDRIRKLDPPKSVPAATIQDFDPKTNKTVADAPVNPFRNSFVVHNPSMPMASASRAQDPFLKTLNAGESFSLLQCKEPWTLLVKDYGGQLVITQDEKTAPQSNWEKIKKFFDADKGRSLAAASVNAHNLADVLKKMGFEAYVLHTRHASFVTVGGFSSEKDPRMLTVQQALEGRLRVGIQQGQKGAPADTASAMALLQLMNPPMPLPVPRP